jgi:Uncharacterized conserved domain (SAYSvFN)
MRRCWCRAQPSRTGPLSPPSILHYLTKTACPCCHRLRPGASWLERAAAQWLRRHRVPDLFMQLLVWLLRPSIVSRTACPCSQKPANCSARHRCSTLSCYLQLIGTALWFAGAPIAAHFSVGPLYVLGTMLALILTNLGTRKAGELSAYSIFNPGARQLPGIGKSLVALLG